jgi:hypothetical protein
VTREVVSDSFRAVSMYEYAGFDPENGKMLYYTAAGTTVFKILDANKDKKYTGSILPSSTYRLL